MQIALRPRVPSDLLATRSSAAPKQQPPDRVELGRGHGATLAGVGGGIVGGLGLGCLGARAGAHLGFAVGIHMPVGEGLTGVGNMLLNGLQGAAWGQLIGGVACCAVGASCGAVLARELMSGR